MSGMGQGAIIEIEDLAAGYGDKLILDGVTVEIPTGAITCIIGGSGSGKSTLLRAMVGLIEARRGTVRVLGTELATLDEDARAAWLGQMGLMYQYGALLNSLTVQENLAIPVRAHTGLSEPVIERLVALKLAQVHLGHAGQLLPGELSGGMRKRAGLARALMLDPQLVLCDEPSAGLDPLTAADLDRLLLSLRDLLGLTLVVVTHELSSITAIADHVVMLRNGRIHFAGPLADATASEDPALRAFFGRRAESLHGGATLLDAFAPGTPA